MKELVEEIAKALVDNPDQVQVRAVEGAPGDGRTSLTRAIRHFLRQSNVRVVDTTGAAPTVAEESYCPETVPHRTV